MAPVSTVSFAISDLRQQPEFFDIVADRIWRASWKEIGTPLDYITGRLYENMNAEPLPIALVAHDGGKFLGTASVIASDLEERPQLTPWVAAVWVETHAHTNFYERRGWIAVERDVGEHGRTVFIRDATPVSVRISSPP